MAIVSKNNILVKPIFTEKSSLLKEQNKYVLEVRTYATKIEIKKAVKDLFKVDVLSVNSLNYLGKNKRVGKFEGKKMIGRK